MLSVVIPTFRKPDQLRQTLEALEADASDLAGACEVVVVDDGSGDGRTPALVREFSGRLPLVDASSPENIGRARARNRGWRAAGGESILFLDDDIRLRPGALQAHLRAQESREAAWMGVVLTAPDISDSILFDYLDSRGTGKLLAGQHPPARYLLTQNVSIPRSALEEIGGFDEDFGSYGFEDMDLAFRLEDAARLPMRYLDAAVGEHVHHHTLGEYLEKKRLCGESTLPRIAELHPNRVPEMRLDLLPGIGGENALSAVLEWSWRFRIQWAVKAVVQAWPRRLVPELAFLGLDYLVMAAYRDGLKRRLP